ncbi:hypothetical protein LXA43DRAFT_1068078 [Ganoderma leucocontextum]|nr:hypothetical protein LXA43DRAFT_1068078 [Ganoderma leucocontextum]
MKGVASLLSLAGVVASAVAPQTSWTLDNNSSPNRFSMSFHPEDFGFLFPGWNEISQCARAELVWENGVPPFKLSIAFGPTLNNLTKTFEVNGLTNHVYPFVVRGPSNQAVVAYPPYMLSGLWLTFHLPVLSTSPVVSPSLRTASLRLSSITSFDTMRLFQNIRFQSLECMELEIKISGDTGDLEALVAALPTPTFRSLSVFLAGSGRGARPNFLEAIHLILSLRALTCLSLRGGGRIYYSASDDDFATMLQALSELETFFEGPGDRPYPSTAILHHFRRYCPKLRSLVPPPMMPGERGLPLLPGSPPTHPLESFCMHIWLVVGDRWLPDISDEEAGRGRMIGLLSGMEDGCWNRIMRAFYETVPAL